MRKEQGLVGCLEAVARCHKLSGAQLAGDQSAIVAAAAALVLGKTLNPLYAKSVPFAP